MAIVLVDDREHHDQVYEEYDILHDIVSILLEEQVTRIDTAKAAVRFNDIPNRQAPVVIHQPLRMPIPTFDGRYESWPKFKAMFKDLVEKGSDTPAVKLYHLDKALVGSAAGLIDAKTINEGNYVHAWTILEERYENKRHAIDCHILGLALGLGRMTKRSHVELRSLVDECSKHVEGLKFLERPFDGVGEDFVIHLLASALHHDVRHLWESTIKHAELPNYDEMLKFLKEQTFILERVEASSQKPVSVPAKPSPSTNRPSVQKAHAAVSSSETEMKCEFCGKAYQNFACSEFKSLSVPQRLVKQESSNVIVAGVNGTKTHSSSSSMVHLSSKYTDFQARVKPAGLHLADPEFFRSSEVDMLLGNEWFLKLLLPGEILFADNLPMLRETQFGWVVGGVYDEGDRSDGIVYSHSVTLDELSQSIQRFWEVEDIGSAYQSSTEEDECELHLQATHRRDASGKYIVELPLKETVSELGDSRSLALKRFRSLERKLSQCPDLKKQYQDFMEEYEVLGHCKEVDESKDPPGTIKWYLPHHAVLRPSNTTTKCRVVFDASAKVSGSSLNDVMKIGAISQSDLQAISIRFRIPLHVLATDVAKMYRQIFIDWRFTPLFRVFWRKDSSEPLRVLELTTVTYDTASAPFLATRALLQLAIDEGGKYPLAADIVKNSFYVDNALFGFDDLNDAAEAQSQLIDLLEAGGFHLHKWASNNVELLNKIPERDRDELVSIDECSANEVIKTLGLLWNPASDSLQFISLPTSDVKCPTKRQVLSLVSRMFDPLGLVAPVIVIGKLLMKSIWKEELDWDEVLKNDMKKKCDYFLNALNGVTNLRMPRQMVVTGASAYQLHGFGDATLEAYGACTSGLSYLVILQSKELLAALLLHRLVKKVIEALALHFEDIVLWSDNQVVLAWLAKNPNNLEVFVRNRVGEITSTGNQFKWKYVNTLENPADVVSRGQSADNLEKNDLWCNGPLFLRSEDYQMVVPTPLSDEEVPELREATVVPAVVQLDQLPVFLKFESFRKLQRVLAYVLRFCRNAKEKVKEKRIIQCYTTMFELRQSLKVIVRVIQLQHFGEEIINIASCEYCKRLSKLNPFLDDGLIRVGGRLRHSSLPYGVMHQLVLPSHELIVQSLIVALHRENLHAGPSALLAQLRRQFWVLGARSAVRKVTRNCVRCFKIKPPIANQCMGDLPVARCDKAPAFLKVGVDFAGPMLIKQTGRKAAPLKGYISVFVCMVTKGIHLEVVENLSSDAFIAALHRFVSRRGVPEEIFSDNGTNFIGARNELNELCRLFKQQVTEQKIFEFCHIRQIQWSTIPPNAPHMGGIWEAGVKSTKTVLKKICQSSLLTMPEFSTLLCQIEAQLNSRPLYALSDDPSEPEPLTPGNFMIDRPLTAIPEPSYEGIPVNRLSRWQYVQRLRSDFWKRWSQEYLLELQLRQKWTKKRGNINPGMVVLIKDDNLPPQYWKIGKVEKTYSGADGMVRMVDVQTKDGLLKRPIHKLAPLPILDNASTSKAANDNNCGAPGGRMFEPFANAAYEGNYLTVYHPAAAC
ncbi:uncharacterized protein LOC135701683 [Ochlerotatus camptorhynchus]|uniref:uncharacterized protein LOC135701683 n=1 Tax=Ochlerotatus camptorhynchus TaxID=644619 RepID=UPI0031D3B022